MSDDYSALERFAFQRTHSTLEAARGTWLHGATGLAAEAWHLGLGPQALVACPGGWRYAEGRTLPAMTEAAHVSIPMDLEISPPDSPFDEIFGNLYVAVRREDGGDARLAWRVPEPGVVYVLAVDRGAMPKGSGGRLIAAALTQASTRPTKRLVIEEIINPPTVDAHAGGSTPEQTVLGKTAINALRHMGLFAGRCSWDVGADKMSMVIEVSASAR